MPEFVRKIKRRFFHSDFQRYYARNVPGTFAVKIANALLKMGLSIVLARYLGPSEYGVYSFVLSMVIILNLPARLGLPHLLVREVAKYQEFGHYSYLKGFIKRATQGVFLVGLLIIAIAFLVTYFFSDQIDVKNVGIFRVGVFMVPLIAVIAVFQAVLKGMKQVVLGSLPEEVIRYGAFFIMVLGFYFYKDSLTALDAMTLHLGGSLVALVMAFWFMTSRLPNGFAKMESVYETRYWIRSAMPFFFLGGLQILMQEVDILLLGLMKSSADTGAYKVAISASRFVFFFSISFNVVLNPIISKYYYSGQKKRLQNILSKNVILVSVIVLPLVLLLTLKGAWLLSFLYGERFADADKALMILALSYFFVVMTGPKTMLAMTGKEKYLVRAKVIMLIVSTGLKFSLIKNYGIEGAALGTGVSMALYSVFLVYYGIKKSGLDTSIFYYLIQFNRKR